MGADVYLESVNNKCKAEWEPKFKAAVMKRDQHPRGSATAEVYQREVSEAYENMYAAGYFRDNYNGYGMSSNLEGFSWWNDVGPLCNEDGYLPIDKISTVRTLLRNAKLNTSRAKEVCEQQKDNPPAGGWDTYYEKCREEFIALLDESELLGEPLRMSL
jgi:hypothetical protein